MLSDPQSVTVNGVARSLPRVPATSSSGGAFRKDDGTTSLSVAHSRQGKKQRHVVTLSESLIAADPLLAGINVKADQRVYFVIEHPETGFSTTQTLNLFKGLAAWASDANVTKIIGYEA